MKVIIRDKDGVGYYLEDTYIDDNGVRHRVWCTEMLDAMMFDSEIEALEIIEAFLDRVDAYVEDALE